MLPMVIEGTNPDNTGTGTAAKIEISKINGKTKEHYYSNYSNNGNKDNFQKSKFKN